MISTKKIPFVNNKIPFVSNNPQQQIQFPLQEESVANLNTMVERV